ncbi:MAG TPA: radical SAM family heme chaperone HemW [Longimicrobiales bacterium]
MNPRSLYIHVPFCLRRCAYCDFAVTATREPPVDAWLTAITAELRSLAESNEGAGPLSLDTVYVGGGTPSLLPEGMMTRLREALSPWAAWDSKAEWTVEANPETLTRALAADWRAAGVNRLSLGAQTFHEPALQWMGRLHGADGPARAFDAAHAAGIDNVSIDLIFGLPARLGRDWDADLARARSLGPTHLSLYGLTAETGTPLGRWVAEGRERLATEDTYETEYLTAAAAMDAAGFEHYEVSNFARPGLASRHNIVYWRHEPYIGLGPGAHSFIAPVRWWNVRDWAAYAAQVGATGSGRADEEIVTRESAALERIWLGLRARPGILRATLSEPQVALVDEWRRNGWVGPDQTYVQPTAAGWLLLDRMAVDLTAAGEAAGIAPRFSDDPVPLDGAAAVPGNSGLNR